MKKLIALITAIVMMMPFAIGALAADGTDAAQAIVSPASAENFKSGDAILLKATAAKSVRGVKLLIDCVDKTASASVAEGETVNTYSVAAENLPIGKHVFEMYSYNADGSMNYNAADFEVYQDNEAIFGECKFDLATEKNIGDAVIATDFIRSNSFWFSAGGAYKTAVLAEGKDGEGDYALEIPFSGTGRDVQPYFEPGIGLSGKIKYSFDIKTDNIDKKTFYFEIKGHSDRISKTTVANNDNANIDNIKINSDGKLWHDDNSSKSGNINNWKSSNFIHMEFIFDTVNGMLTAYADGKKILEDSSKFKCINKITIGYYGTGSQSVIFDNLKLSADASVNTLKNVTYKNGDGDITVTNGYIPETAASISVEFPFMVHKGFVKAEINTIAIDSAKISTSKTDAEIDRINLLETKEAEAILSNYVNKAEIALDNLSVNDVIRIYIPRGENYAAALKQGAVSSVEYKQLADVFETRLTVADKNGLYIERVNGDIGAAAKFEFVRIANIGNAALSAALFQTIYTGEALNGVKLVKESVPAKNEKVFGGCVDISADADYRAFLWNADKLTPLLP